MSDFTENCKCTMIPFLGDQTSTEPTALTEESIQEAFGKARKLLEDLYSRPMIHNYRIFESWHIGDHQTKERERTWKERLFSLPWRPCKKMEFYTIVVPNGDIFIDRI